QTVAAVTVAAPRVVWDRCTHHRTTTGTLVDGEAFYATGTLQGVTLKNSLAVCDGLSLTGSPGGNGSLVIVQNDSATRAKVVLEDNEIVVSGTYTSGTPVCNAVRLRGNCQLKVDGLVGRLNVTSWGSLAARFLDLGNSSSSNLSGTISGVEVLDS